MYAEYMQKIHQIQEENTEVKDMLDEIDDISDSAIKYYLSNNNAYQDASANFFRYYYTGIPSDEPDQYDKDMDTIRNIYNKVTNPSDSDRSKFTTEEYTNRMYVQDVLRNWGLYGEQIPEIERQIEVKFGPDRGYNLTRRWDIDRRKGKGHNIIDTYNEIISNHENGLRSIVIFRNWDIDKFIYDYFDSQFKDN